MNINKYAFDNSELSEIELLESIQLAEEFINEATWHNSDKFASHYSDHVLKDGEPFASNNPKFAPMSPDEYKEMAEWLTYAPAHKATYKVVYDKRDGTEKRIMDTRAPIIGFVLKHKEGDKDLLQRYIKI